MAVTKGELRAYLEKHTEIPDDAPVLIGLDAAGRSQPVDALTTGLFGHDEHGEGRCFESSETYAALAEMSINLGPHVPPPAGSKAGIFVWLAT